MNPERDDDDFSGARRRRPKVGQPFSPYRQFPVLPMPDSLLESRELPPGAKLVYGRLCRYAGEKTFCWPTPATVAEKVGLGERQVQKHLRLLERRGFLRREKRFENGAQISNRIYLLWHASFEAERPLGEGVKSNSPRPVNSSSLNSLNRSASKEGHREETTVPPKSHSQRKGFPFGDSDAYSTEPE